MMAGQARTKARRGGLPALARFALVAVAVALAACAGGNDKPRRNAKSDPNVGPCPLMGVLYDASRQVIFTGGDERFASVAYTGEVQGVNGLCRYRGTEPIVMSLDIDMAFGKGPAATEASHTYRYWVAVARRDTAPIAKQYFDVNVTFPPGADRVGGAQHIERNVIPRAEAGTSGTNFEILVGFDLTPQQLDFNRQGKRFRVDAGAPS
ncbi:MAG: hypothetical protein AB7G04_05040 [Hyphomonadaceae bacterium]